MALAQVLFPKNWIYRSKGSIEICGPHRKKCFQIKIHFYVYETLSQLFLRLNIQFMATTLQAELEYSYQTNKVYLFVAPDCTFKFNDSINEILGFTKTSFEGK
jgi:hypothetical protein